MEKTEGGKNARPFPQYVPLTLGMLVNEVVGGAQSGRFWSGVVDVAAAHDANVLCFAGRQLRDPHEFDSQANVVFDLVDRASVDGLVIWASLIGSYLKSDDIQRFCDRFRPLPIVSVGMVLKGIPSIVLDSYHGVYAAVTHLVESHGRRRIAFIRGPENHRDAIERYRAYTDVLKDHEIAFSPELISQPCGWVEQGGVDAVRLWLDQRKIHFDAVIAVNDNLASGALRALQARGIRVPDDVAVTGFNDQPVSRTITPPLTTIPLRMYERGRRAAEMLLAMIDGKPVPAETTLASQLILRQSCGCPDPAVLQASAPISDKDWESTPICVLSEMPASPREFLAANRRRILSEMEQAVDVAEGGRERVEQILDAFIGDLNRQAPCGFLPALEVVLDQVANAGGDVIAWERVISTLRRHVLLSLRGNEHACRHAEDLWHQARVMIGERARRAQAYQEWETGRQFDKLREIGQAMTTALDVPSLMSRLAQELPLLGLGRCYLSLYEDPHQPAEWSRLVLAFDETGRIDLGPGGRRFPSRRLVPEGMLSPEKLYHLIVEPLYFREEQLGFLLLDGKALGGNIRGLLRDRIDSALKGVYLLQQNIQLYHQALEAQKMAQEREQIAEEANLLKSRFLSTVSHELLTPLVVLVGLSEMMLREGTPDTPGLAEPFRQDVERIHASAQQLDSLIRDVLDLARGHMGQLQLVKKPFDLGEMLQVVALIGEPMVKAKGLEWCVEIPPLPKVLGDPTRLKQVTLNLVTNAIKFTARGQVVLRATSDGEYVTVSIRDTGLGVPIAEQQVIFDEFRQSARTATRGYSGLGIGLAICRQLIELHGGRIGVVSSGEEDGGSTFYFTLPILREPVAEPSIPETHSRTVLLLREGPNAAPHLQEHLTRAGFAVNAVDIQAVPDWLSVATAAPPGAVLFDFQPVSERGWDLIEALKRNPATQDVPVLFYSLFRERGSGSVLALDYMTKPMGTEALAQALARHGLESGLGKEKKLILVVDDDPAVLEVHTRIVAAHLPDCRVLTASNGRIALQSMQQESPALVLLDLLMPELDGMGVLEAMQANERLRGIPVIVLTAQRLTQDDMARLNRGVAAVLEKGIFSVPETLLHIEQALARTKKLGSETQRIVRKVMAFVHEHYAEDVSREKMASYAGVSARHLTRCFCQEIGVSPITYLNRCRIKQAKRLLEAGDKNITEVAQAVGFSDSSYFSRVFRSEVGVSPRQYRYEADNSKMK